MQIDVLVRTWRLVALDAETYVAAHAHAVVTLHLDRAKAGAHPWELAVSGASGCNRYFGRCRVEGDQLHCGALGVTRMACPPAQMALERRYLAALHGDLRWQFECDALLFDRCMIGADGALRFEPVVNNLE